MASRGWRLCVVAMCVVRWFARFGIAGGEMPSLEEHSAESSLMDRM